MCKKYGKEEVDKKMKIFDLEQEIMKAWHVIDDIELLYENVIETDMSTDDITNALIGLESIYNMRFQKIFNMFEDLCKEYHAMRKENEKNTVGTSHYADPLSVQPQ